MERRCRKRWRSDRPQTCGLRARFPDCLSTHRFACFDGQHSGRECIFPFRTVPQFSMVVPLRSQARLWHSLLHWGLRTGLRFAGPVFRGCGALRAVLAPSPLRGFDGNGLFRAQRAAFVRPAYGGPVFRRCAPPSPSAARCSGAADAFWACPRASSRFAAFACALRVLAPPAASRPPTASGRGGNAFLPTVRNRRSTSHAKRACGSCCSLGLLRPVSATGGGLRAPREKCQK